MEFLGMGSRQWAVIARPRETDAELVAKARVRARVPESIPGRVVVREPPGPVVYVVAGSVAGGPHYVLPAGRGEEPAVRASLVARLRALHPQRPVVVDVHQDRPPVGAGGYRWGLPPEV